MSNGWFIASALLALVAGAWVILKSREWESRARIDSRMQASPDSSEDAASRNAFEKLAWRLANSPLTRDDFMETQHAVSAMGRSAGSAQLIYFFYCWVLPAIAIFLGFTLFGALGGMLCAVAAFILPRRIIRGMGRSAEKQQNREAVELCHMTRMLMEAGLSLERVMRMIAAQARPLMPKLVLRIDRFNRLMESGAERNQALDELGENRSIPVLRSYVMLMKQSSQLGAGVSSSLEQIILEARDVERSKLKEETNRIGAKITVVMMVFMLPALFIIIGGPAVISIADALSR
ncbi:type II secretion system F family protein [Alloalcanivorax xenomutans]|uniref:type II secretion system F family protein n=1 Tax=Alloalcanivorax xenomutans TaxID=1094342 RepID=UPI00183448DA|nr:type II secretion system F family protein [Alcanivorax sp.]MCE7523034.1 type II secretion system F family protein [Alloalcanivorax xenomutans]